MKAIKRIQYLLNIINSHKLLWVFSVIGICVAYYAAMLLALIVKFQAIPNYMTVYEWIDNVGWIVVSTPSIRDALLIISEEWWLEIGFMNYDFGMGISEWSLFIAPWKVLSVLVFSALFVTYIIVKRNRRQVCSNAVNYSSKITSGLAGLFFGFTSLTMSWVVCCATPTWVVGLAMLGLGVSTSLSIEPVGFWFNAFGFILMVVALYMVSNNELDDDNDGHFVNNSIRNKL
ncbi:MAG: hypothetical protein ACI9T9_001010 [Oleiphilaceae bacterium]|jgi:hypothetical protein